MLRCWSEVVWLKERPSAGLSRADSYHLYFGVIFLLLVGSLFFSASVDPVLRKSLYSHLVFCFYRIGLRVLLYGVVGEGDTTN